jgi:transposase
MTKAGTPHVRRALVEGAWTSRYAAEVSRQLQLRLEKQPNIIQDISWKAQLRLCQCYRRLVARGKHNNVVTALRGWDRTLEPRQRQAPDGRKEGGS